MRWETKFSIQVLLLGVGLFLVAPLAASLLGLDIPDGWSTLLTQWTASPLFRQVTGYVGLAFVLFQALLSLRKRTSIPLGLSYPLWRAIHILSGVGLLLVIMVHTGGRWGWNLNGWLLSALMVTVFVGLVGKAVETKIMARLTERPDTSFRPSLGTGTFPGAARYAMAGATGLPSEAAAPGIAVPRRMWSALVPGFIWPRSAAPRSNRLPLNRIRSLWLGIHIVLTSAFFAFLSFHVLSVYYF